jgi:hypothetical protein
MSEAPIHGWATTKYSRRVQLSEQEARAIWDSAKAADRRRKEAMPTEESAIQAFFDAHTRLKEFGWREIIYSPKGGGGEFNVLEAGSTGIHRCVYQGEWPKGSWWILEEDGDQSPSHPVLFKLDPGQEAERQTRMAEGVRRWKEKREAEGAGATAKSPLAIKRP